MYGINSNKLAQQKQHPIQKPMKTIVPIAIAMTI
jgi:hypothetical protein